LDLLLRDGKVIRREHGEISQLAGRDGAFLTVFARKPTASDRVEPKGLLAIEAVFLRIQAQAADRFSGYEPVERKEWVVTGNPGGIRPCPHRNAHLEHPPDGRCTFRLLRAIAFHEVFPLEGHPVLYGNAAAQRFDPLDVLVRYGFAVIEEPVQAVKWDLAVHL